MKTVALTEFGAAENLTDAHAERPAIEAHEVLMQIRACGFNPIDYQIRQAGFEALEPPMVLGFEVAGVVSDIGSGITTLARGQEVMAWLGGPSLAGGYAEYAAVPAAFVTRKPEKVSFAQAAAVPLAGLTALRSLRRGRLSGHRSLLVAGGAGGVGSWTILLAKALGAHRIVTTAGSESSRDYLRTHLGLADDQIIGYVDMSRADLAAAARAANEGALFDVTVDCVGKRMTSLCCDVVDFEGTVISLVNAPKDNSYPPEDADEEALFRRSAAFHCELAFAQAEYGSPSSYPAYTEPLDYLSALISQGSLTLPRVTTLGNLCAVTARAAHRLLESGHTHGKLVAVVD
jgi:NADPH2:quinone reductase